MKMTKKALSAMIAASIAATALPAAAMMSNLSNTLASSNSDGANNTSPQTTPAAAPETSAQTAAPAVQAEPSAESIFITEDVEGGVAITGFKTDDANFTSKVVIPPTINDKTVVSLKSNNYQNCMDGADQVASLDTSLCASLSIGEFAFFECTGITGSIDLSKCASVGQQAFAGCTGITGSVDLSSCTSIGNSAFSGCTGITGSIDLSKCASVGECAFSFCTGITGSVDLSSCTIIGESAFTNCSGITDVTWPTNNMSTIPVGCFSGCASLKTFNSKTDFNLSGITSVGDYVFSDCTGITGSVNLSKCTSIGSYAFYSCKSITGSVDLSSCTSIGDFAFSACTGITGSVDLSSCTSVGNSAFRECTGITDVTWPTNNMSTIPEYCFAYCTSLKTFNNDTDFNLSDITSVGNSAFRKCTGITSITFPTEHSYTIGNDAFRGCTSIKSIDLSNCISIGEAAFNACPGITDVTWPTNNMPTIPDSCFTGCKSLKTFNNNTDFNLSGITSVGTQAFASCTGITGSVDLSSCNTVGNYAFQNCSGITGSVDLSSCTSVGDSAFSGCPNLIPTISTKTATVKSNAFSDCPYVTIQAADEAKLASYCSGIANTGDLEGLSSVKKLASIPGVTNQIPAGLSYDLTGNIPDENATYYLTASQKSDYAAKDGYAAANVYDIALKGVKNGESAVSTMSGTVPISITTSEYHSDTSYYLEVNGALSSAIAPTDNGDGTHTFTQDVALGESSSTVALVYQIMVSSVEISGNNTVPYSENGTAEFSAKITPDNALNQNVTWSSDNENVLKFSDPNSGTATIIGIGSTTITVATTDGSGATDSKEVWVTPALGAGYTIDYANEKISAIDDAYEVSNTSDFAKLLSAEDQITPGETLYVRAKDTTVYAENKLPERPATPTTPEIKQTAKMVQVTNGKTGQEYKFKKPTDTNHTATFDVWQDSPVLIDDDMTDGVTYIVTTRVKATGNSFASEESSSNAYVAKDTPKNNAHLDGGSNGDEWTDGTATYNADTPYEIPVRLKTEGGDTYMVEIDWGNMLFSYNFGTWDTETLSYNDDPATLHWGTSFDGTNNQVTVINRSSSEIDTTLNLALNQEQQTALDSLGFHLTKGNTNDNANNYPATAQTLQSGATGNSTTAYVNIGADDLTPPNNYDQKTQIGNITVTVQKAN